MNTEKDDHGRSRTLIYHLLSLNDIRSPYPCPNKHYFRPRSMDDCKLALPTCVEQDHRLALRPASQAHFRPGRRRGPAMGLGPIWEKMI